MIITIINRIKRIFQVPAGGWSISQFYFLNGLVFLTFDK